MKYILTTLIVIAILMLFTNPSDEFVKLEAAKAVKERVEQKMGGFKLNFVESLATAVIKEAVTVNDYYLFKQATYTFDGKTTTIGYGCFSSFITLK